ncbi:hypothetical protein RF679_13180 [Undibacterium cyanobacteriorum]|uniref:Glycine zipper 2TM domain-containing protein n=1 Tax=Undibacterium cyanobacteriorum TaxID=3073561 RepID=A0ABY9RG18_9BURK|nr:hypothetical protein [Undibacterium sp. 20NA77.5]WMW79599.1 hypothetical protein RF679_13180 [Undibacterium sp. 20NA77.5]
MRTAALILALVAVSQLSGCVVHRQYTRSPYQSQYGAEYQTNYPAQYPGQYGNQYSGSYQQNYQNPQPAYASQYQDANQNGYNSYPNGVTEVAQIVGIRNIAQARESSGGGAVVGAIIGGIIGNQIARDDSGGRSHDRGNHRGYGRGYERRGGDNDGSRTAATVGGAIIGGLIGNEIDRSSSEPQSSITEITFRLANGQAHAVRVNNPGQLRVGDRVRVSFQNGAWTLQ